MKLEESIVIYNPEQQCRVCTISSDSFNYFNIFEKKIYNNVLVHDALMLITQLVISKNDDFPKTICCRCEQRLLDAYHFRKLAESSARHFTDQQRLLLNQSLNRSNDSAYNVIPSPACSNSPNTQTPNGNDRNKLERTTVADVREGSTSPFTGFDNDVSATDLHKRKYAEPRFKEQKKAATATVTGIKLIKSDQDSATVEVEINDTAAVSDVSNMIEIIATPKKTSKSTKRPERKSTRTPSKRSSSRNQVPKPKSHNSQPRKTGTQKTHKRSTTGGRSSSSVQNKASKSPLVPATPTTTAKPENKENVVLNKTLVIQNYDTVDAVTFLIENVDLSKPKTEQEMKTEAYERRKHRCQVCGKRFVGKSNLVDHLRYHANVKPYKCRFCMKTFVQSGSLVCHERTHTREKPYVCQICQKSFSQTSSLKIHIRTHTQERNFVCEVCQKRFLSHSDVAKHRRIHDKIKRFQCTFCDKGFSQNANLQKHLKTHDRPSIVPKVEK